MRENWIRCFIHVLRREETDTVKLEKKMYINRKREKVTKKRSELMLSDMRNVGVS